MSIQDDINQNIVNKNKTMQPFLCSTCLSALDGDRGQHATPCMCGNNDKAWAFKKKLEWESRFIQEKS